MKINHLKDVSIEWNFYNLVTEVILSPTYCAL